MKKQKLLLAALVLLIAAASASGSKAPGSDNYGESAMMSSKHKGGS